MARLFPPIGLWRDILIWLLDTDYLSILERGGSTALPIQIRLDQVPIDQIGTTIVNYEEQMRGWLSRAAQANIPTQLQKSYARLEAHVATFRALTVLSFNAQAASEFERLLKARIRIGTMDLRIAAICLANNATLLTRNSKDFGQVPGLKFEDWSV